MCAVLDGIASTSKNGYPCKRQARADVRITVPPPKSTPTPIPADAPRPPTYFPRLSYKLENLEWAALKCHLAFHREMTLPIWAAAAMGSKTSDILIRLGETAWMQ